MSRNSSRWLPALIVPAVVAAGIVALPLQAGAAVDLPDKTAAEVLSLVSTSTEQSFSGSVTKTADIGLPNLDFSSGMSQSSIDSMSEQVPEGMEDLVPQGATTGAMSAALEALSGTQEGRVFVDGPSKVRVQIADRFAERNFVSNGADAWYFDSNSNTAAHLAIPADAETRIRAKVAELKASAPADMSNPAEVAKKFLAEIDPSTNVAVGTDAKVAGRTVYELIFTPKAVDTLAASVSIAVDSETGLPLQVTVMAKGQDAPAFRVGFTTIDLTTPDASLFTFTPAAGVTVEEIPVPEAPAADVSQPSIPVGAEPVVTGEGWDAIVEVPSASVPSELAAFASNPAVAELTTAVDGGRLLTTSLINVLLTTDGRVLVGSVSVERLQAAAAE